MGKKSGIPQVFGRYYAQKSCIHALDARTKCLALAFLMAACLCASSWLGLACAVAAIVVSYLLARIPVNVAIKAVLPLMVFVLLTTLFNLFFRTGGTIYFSWFIFTISSEGLYAAAFFGVRLTALLFVACLLTLTTTISDITYATERLLHPLTYLHVPVSELAAITSLAMSNVSVFAQEYVTVKQAMQSRCAPFQGSLKVRLNTLGMLLSVLFKNAFARADTLACAMDARCFACGKQRGRLHPLSFALRDGVALCFVVFVLVACILL